MSNRSTRTPAPSNMESHGPDFILTTRGLEKSFSGFKAVSGISLNVRRGSIHALIGPNGAGKTTCFNLLTKFLLPSAGVIHFNGKDITKLAPAAIAQLGMVRSFQISAVFGHMTALENVRVALQRKRKTSMDFWRSRAALSAFDERSMDLLTSVGLQDFAHTQAMNLSYGRKRALELATTLALEPELMLLDEPTAGMTAADVDLVTDLIRRVAVNRTVLMVEHNLKVVSSLSDQISILARGQILAEGSYDVVSKDPRVVEAYIGAGHA